jgi:hypothetical protein
MGGGSKELSLIDSIRHGDAQSAIKYLLKNKHKIKCDNSNASNADLDNKKVNLTSSQKQHTESNFSTLKSSSSI